MRIFQANSRPVMSVQFSSNSQAVLTGDWDRPKLWDIVTGRLLHVFDGPVDDGGAAALSPDGRSIVSGFRDGKLRIWDVATHRLTHTYEIFKQLKGNGEGTYDRDAANGGEAVSVAFSPDGRLILTTFNGGGQDGVSFTLTDVKTGHKIDFAYGGWGVSAAFSPDSRSLLLSRGGETDLFDLGSGKIKLLRKFEERTGGQAVTFSPDGSSVAAGYKDLSNDKLIIWDVVTGRLLRGFEGQSISALAFSPDGHSIASGKDHEVNVWDVFTEKLLHTFEGHSDAVTTVAFAPDGRSIASGSRDGTTRLWSTVRGELTATAIASHAGDWLMITPEGFFSASQRDPSMLAVVRGLDVTAVGQVHQSLYNPDLVREALAGDPDGEVKRAAEVINLEKVLDAGPPPAVAITSHKPGSRWGKDIVAVAARITIAARASGGSNGD